MLMHNWLLKNIYIAKLQTLAVQANDPLKLNNVKNTCLINPNVTYLYFSLNISEYLEYYQHQYFNNQPKNHTHLVHFASFYQLQSLFEYLPFTKHTGYVFNWEFLAFNWSISTPLTNQQLLLHLQFALKQNFFTVR